MRLNLGCGDDHRPGFLGVDIAPQADIQHDLSQPLPCESDSVEELYAKHIIEHFDEKTWRKIIKDWARVIIPGGKLTIECPDVSRLFGRWLTNSQERRDYWMLCIYGEAWKEGMAHKNGFYLEKLTHDLSNAGFSIIKADWLYDDTPDINGFNIKVEAIWYQ